MAKQECEGFLSQIQESGAQDVMLEMLRLVMQTVLEEGISATGGRRSAGGTATVINPGP